eukprot:6199773-Pleurochrysis_carterae.AAC.3
MRCDEEAGGGGGANVPRQIPRPRPHARTRSSAGARTQPLRQELRGLISTYNALRWRQAATERQHTCVGYRQDTRRLADMSRDTERRQSTGLPESSVSCRRRCVLQVPLALLTLGCLNVQPCAALSLHAIAQRRSSGTVVEAPRPRAKQIRLCEEPCDIDEHCIYFVTGVLPAVVIIPCPSCTDPVFASVDPTLHTLSAIGSRVDPHGEMIYRSSTAFCPC